MKYVFLVNSLNLLMVTMAMAEEKWLTLFDFTGADAAKEWQILRDRRTNIGKVG
jgi:hypothetical protein